MRPTERATVRRARLLVKAGDRAGALRLLEELAEPPPRSSPPASTQLALVVVLSLPFHCKRLNRDDMPVRECLTRRSRTWAAGGGKGSAAPEATACKGCGVGMHWSVQLPRFRPPRSTLAPVVLPNSQRLAKRARALVNLGDDEVVRVDPLREAATMSPDDPNDWRA